MATAAFLALPARADPVTDWTALADRLGRGGANWRTLAVMHQAMHDAWNAADPRYARWFPPAPGEPAPGGARPEASMAAAARRVLIELHPEDAATIEAQYSAASVDRAGAALGDAVGLAAARRRAADGYERRHRFAPGSGTGRWRPAPDDFADGGTTETHPFLVGSEREVPSTPPPAPESAATLAALEETYRLGGNDSLDRTDAQSRAAIFWAYQSSQRGFVALGAELLRLRPRPGGLAAHARIMSVLAAAMADSAILTWREKERYGYWRPITAIREILPGGQGWAPFLGTPGHPEYPSGHAADCYTGAAVLIAALPDTGAVTYRVQPGAPTDDSVGMGQHAQHGGPGATPAREFPGLAAAAQECADSRIWAGAHTRLANEESRRLAAFIAGRARNAVPPIGGAR